MEETTTQARTAKEGRRRWLLKRLTALGKDENAMRSGESWTALRGLHAEIRHYRAEYDAIRLELAQADDAAGHVNAEDMTADEWRERIEADARSASLEDLEVYVSEYYDRSRLTPVADGGVIRLVHSAS